MARFYLLFSAAGLCVIALSYGVAPVEILPKLLNITVNGTDLTHIFRAIMGLYMGMIVLWVLGSFQANLTRAAVIAEIVFMIGLFLGRVLSIIVDGVPSILLVLYAILEITMGLWGVLVLKKLSTTQLDRDHTTFRS
jgi:hypothetical protein